LTCQASYERICCRKEKAPAGTGKEVALADNKIRRPELRRSDGKGQIVVEKIVPSGRHKAAETVDLMSIERLPHDLDEQKAVSGRVTMHILDIFAGRISVADHVLFNAEASSPQCAHLWPVFDETLISEAATLGCHIFWSDLVLRRISQWHDWPEIKDGPELLGRLFSAVVTSSRVRRGLEQHPMAAPELYASRRQALGEMKALCKKLNASTVGSTRLPKGAELYDLIGIEVDTPERYPLLRKNWTSLCNYLKQQDLDQGGNFTKQMLVRSSGVTPGEIVNGWFDWWGCTSEGQSRKIISGIGSRKRR
jgi:hypothetical protein